MAIGITYKPKTPTLPTTPTLPPPRSDMLRSIPKPDVPPVFTPPPQNKIPMGPSGIVAGEPNGIPQAKLPPIMYQPMSVQLDDVPGSGPQPLPQPMPLPLPGSVPVKTNPFDPSETGIVPPPINYTPAPMPTPNFPAFQPRSGLLADREAALQARLNKGLGNAENLQRRIGNLQARQGAGEMYAKNYSGNTKDAPQVPDEFPDKPKFPTPNDKPGKQPKEPNDFPNKPKQPKTPDDFPKKNKTPNDAPKLSSDKAGLDWLPSEAAEWVPPKGFHTFFNDVGEYSGTEPRRRELKKEKNRLKKEIKQTNKDVNQRDLKKLKRLRDKKRADKKERKESEDEDANITYEPSGKSFTAGIVEGEQDQGKEKKDKSPVDVGDVLTKAEKDKRRLQRLRKKKNRLQKKLNNQNNARNRPQPGTPGRPYRSRGTTNSGLGFGGKLRI